MSLRNIFDRKKKRTVVIVQCRLSSTRLPRKALLPLGGKPLVEWTLAAMKKVKADAYYLATDVDSGPELEGIARAAGFSFYAGARDDVLDRFLKTIELSKAYCSCEIGYLGGDVQGKQQPSHQNDNLSHYGGVFYLGISTTIMQPSR